MLNELVVIDAPALYPNTQLLFPVRLFARESVPKAQFLFPVVFRESAEYPKELLLFHVVSERSELYPTAQLFAAVLTAKACCPTATEKLVDVAFMPAPEPSATFVVFQL